MWFLFLSSPCSRCWRNSTAELPKFCSDVWFLPSFGESVIVNFIVKFKCPRVFRYGYGSIPITSIFLGGYSHPFTSYFGVNRRVSVVLTRRQNTQFAYLVLSFSNIWRFLKVEGTTQIIQVIRPFYYWNNLWWLWDPTWLQKPLRFCPECQHATSVSGAALVRCTSHRTQVWYAAMLAAVGPVYLDAFVTEGAEGVYPDWLLFE